MAKPTVQLDVPLVVRLREATVSKLTEKCGGSSPVPAMESAATQFFDHMANGGFVLSPQEIDTIEKHYGKPINSTRDIIKATEAKAGLEDGLPTFKFSVDPGYLPPLEQRAREMGTTVEDLMRMVVEQAFYQQWIYGVVARGIQVTFSPEEAEFFRAQTGKQGFTAEDIAVAFRKRKNVLREVAEPEPVGVA